MENTEVQNAIRLKEKYGDNFFINYLRTRRAPITFSNNNMIFGLLSELNTYLNRDIENQPIINDISQFSLLRNATEQARAINLLTNLGLNYTGQRVPPEINVPIIQTTVPPTENSEKVGMISGVPKNTECPICLETIGKSGYYTEKCHNFFHKECLEQHCIGKRPCTCPICRRSFHFINVRGGKKRKQTRKKYRKNKSKRNKRKTMRHIYK